MSISFHCACCENDFVSERSEDDALAELALTAPAAAPADCAMVCDDCYKTIMARMYGLPKEEQARLGVPPIPEKSTQN